MQDKAPIRSQTLGPAMPGNVSVQSTGQHKGNESVQSQHGSDWADVREHSELSIPTVAFTIQALLHVISRQPRFVARAGYRDPSGRSDSEASDVEQLPTALHYTPVQQAFRSHCPNRDLA